MTENEIYYEAYMKAIRLLVEEYDEDIYYLDKRVVAQIIACQIEFDRRILLNARKKDLSREEFHDKCDKEYEKVLKSIDNQEKFVIDEKVIAEKSFENMKMFFDKGEKKEIKMIFENQKLF